MAFGLRGNQVNGIIRHHCPVSYDMSMIMPSKDGTVGIELPIQNIKTPTVVNLLLVASSILQTKVAVVEFRFRTHTVLTLYINGNGPRKPVRYVDANS